MLAAWLRLATRFRTLDRSQLSLLYPTFSANPNMQEESQDRIEAWTKSAVGLRFPLGSSGRPFFMWKLRRRLVTLAALGAGFATGMLIVSWALPERDVAVNGPEQALEIPELDEPGQDWDLSLGRIPRFANVTERTGITFRHFNGFSGKFHYAEIMGAGVALFDYNGDGYLDIYLANGNHLLEKPSPEITNRLYRNNGDWTFKDVTEEAGVGDAGYGQGCCVGDYDNDGDPDLYVSNFGPNVLYENRGDGTFATVTKAAGVEDPLWGQSSSFLDYDGDGWLDLYVQNYLTHPRSETKEAFIYVGGRKVLDYPSPLEFPGSPDHLYRNNGNRTFTDVTRQAGMFRPDGKGMGSACLDFDDDGDVDIFVTNDSTDNYLFRNRGNGTFEETGLSAGVAFDGNGIPEGSMGVGVGDFDGDGRVDFMVPCLARQIYTLYRNLGDRFEDASIVAGLARATSMLTGFNANFLDYDNDGDLDLFFTNGGVRRNEFASPDGSYDERYGKPDLLLANDGKGRFTDVSHRAGPHFQEELVGRGSATGDLDNDGRIDIVISNLAGRPVILRNETRGGHWVVLHLTPAAGNRDALGASVWVEAGGRTQRAVIHGDVSYLSQSDRRVHFGLGNAEKIDRLEILWPDRKRQSFEDLPVDRFLRIEQGKEVVR